MSADKIKKAKAYRKIEIRRIEELLVVANQAETTSDFHVSLQVQYETIESIKDEFFKQHNSLVGLVLEKGDDAVFEEEDSVRKAFERSYYSIKASYFKLFNTAKNSVGEQPFTPSKNSIVLPRIDLPTFSGDVTSFPAYICMFDALVGTNQDLSDVQKFQYLLSSVHGAAFSLIKNLPMTNSNYSIAYDIICKRFKNDRLITSAHWSAIANTPKLNSENPRELRAMLDIFEENLEALKKFNLPVDQWDFILVQMILKRLDSATAKRFELHHNQSEIPKYSDVKTFLNKECLALNNVYTTNKDKFEIKPKVYSKPRYPSSTTSLMVQTNAMTCPFCKTNHSVYKCPEFLRQSPSDRYQSVKNNKLCTNCLSSSHPFRNCKSTFACHKCQQKHHTLLHFDQVSPSPPAIAAREVATSIPSSSAAPQLSHPIVDSSLTLFNASSVTSSVLLATARIEVLDSQGSYQPLRCLFDSGSMTSFITQRSVRRLGLRPNSFSIGLQGLGPMQSVASHGAVTLSLRPIKQEGPILITEAVVLPKICDSLPTSQVTATDWTHLSNITLADPEYHRPAAVDILLGADLFPQILLDKHIPGPPGQPDALNTIFGYILMGKIYPSPSTTVTSLFCKTDDFCPLNTTIQQLWEVETVPSVEALSPDDGRCEELFAKTHTRVDGGRYMVALPFREPSLPTFPGSRAAATQRFLSLERRLLKQPALYEQYSTFLREYLDLKHMQPVSHCENDFSTYYVPHHCVLKPESRTTKLRVVFNASFKLPNQLSLNDHLFVGPKLQRDIVTILLNFRLHQVVLTADICQMYRQILVKPEHCEYQRILWRFSPNDPVQDFKLNTVVYGVTSSPYLAIRVLLQLAEDEGTPFPLAAHALRHDTYIDDIVCGSSSLENVSLLKSQLISLLKKGGFDLRKWSTNQPTLLNDIPTSHWCMDPLSFDTAPESSLKILGLQWNPASDSFRFSIQSLSQPCTKRNLLSNLAKIFDPLGILTPVTFLVKHLIQRIWSLKIAWDQAPTPEIIRLWETYIADVPTLSTLNVPRLLVPPHFDSCELHCFGDASERGYCAVAYFVFFAESTHLSSQFVLAKSKVAPLKKISLPRLELCAAVLVARLISLLCKVYDSKITFSRICCWSDSTVVLSWLNSSPHRWKTFVANRVALIQDKTVLASWSHVASLDNPADVGSRGLLPAELLHCVLWWAGPSFLRNPSLRGVAPTDHPPTSEVLVEERSVSLVTFVATNVLESLLEDHSSFSTINRLVGYILRFAHNSRISTNKRSGSLTSVELYHASLVLTTYTQSKYFFEEITLLRQEKPLPKVFQKLSPFLEAGVLRVGGRLKHLSVSLDRKCPALLPSRSRLTDLYIKFVHLKYFHAGVQTVQFLISQRFWIISSKRSIRRVLSQCVRCYRTNPFPLQPPMGDLPPARLSHIKPFLHTGVDYAGPFSLLMSRHRGARSTKAYLCLFVCMSTKALHLELASTLSSEAFLAALRRFVARRGRCAHLYSDCGSNFVGAHRQLNEYLHSAASEEAITWHFNPPSAPHFGGLWEAGVKSVKTHFMRVVGEQVLTYEELLTIFVQIEAMLNSRPLTPFSNDPDDLNCLTPGHFLNLSPLTAIPEPDLTTMPINRLTRWQLLSRMHQDFWARWSKEYLHTLHQRSKWHQPATPIALDTLVLIKNDNMPPLKWPMGRVVATHPGVDGIVRVVTVRTANGKLKRPVVKCCPLPLDVQI